MIGKSSKIWIGWRENPNSPRYNLHHGIGGKLLQVVPWLNAVLIIALLVFVTDRITVAPGIRFELPPSPIEEAISDNAPKAILLNATEGEQAILFYDDIRYRLTSQAECDCLSAAITRSVEKNRWTSLILYADKYVHHQDVMKFVAIARKAGAKEILIATDSEN